MDPFVFGGISVATYRVGVACYKARDTIWLGRKVESVLHAFLTEQTIHKEYRCYFSSYVYTSTLESNERELWSNASIRTALEAEYGFEKAHSILATLWETEENILEIYALLNLVSQMTNRSRYSKQGENALLALRTYLASKGTTIPTRNSILEVLEGQIERIKILNKNVFRLLSCPNQLKLSCTATPASQATSTQKKPLQNTKSSLPSTYSTPILMHPISISEQLHNLLSLDINPETQEILLLPPSNSDSFPADQEHALSSYSTTLPPKLPWWKILLASPHRSFFIVQALLFILGIGVTISWALWKGDLGTATGCGGLVFAIGSSANMVWDKCHSNPVTEATFLLKES